MWEVKTDRGGNNTVIYIFFFLGELCSVTIAVKCNSELQTHKPSAANTNSYLSALDHLYGLVVSVLDYRSRGTGHYKKK
jgi:hypothetical protein